MEKVYPITLQVAPGEKAFALYEITEQPPDNSGMHRYQIILVNRGDRLAEYRIDMGKGSLWKHKRFINIPSLWVHSIAELQFIAEQIRNEPMQDELDIAELMDNNGQVVKCF